MNKLVKGALIFIGGVTVGFVSGTVVVVGKAIENERIRNAITKSIADKISNAIYGCKQSSYSENTYRRYYDKHADKPFFDNREEAERVLSQLRKVIDLYGYCTVADMYDLCGIVSNYTDYKYGWTTLKDAKITRVCIRDGYTFELPKVVAVD